MATTIQAVAGQFVSKKAANGGLCHAVTTADMMALAYVAYRKASLELLPSNHAVYHAGELMDCTTHPTWPQLRTTAAYQGLGKAQCCCEMLMGVSHLVRTTEMPDCCDGQSNGHGSHDGDARLL